jgi:hypothetical protein
MMAETAGSKLADQAPSFSDVSAFVAWAQAFRGPDHVAVRREAEDEARDLLNARAGRMTMEDAEHLGRLFNTDSKQGEVRHDRFVPAFVGATLQKVVDDLETFNRQVGRLWNDNEDVALVVLEEDQVSAGLMMNERIAEELALLRKSYPDLEYVASGHWVRLPKYDVPGDLWEQTVVEVCFQIPELIPGQPPYGFYVRPGLTLRGAQVPGNYAYPAATPFGSDWGKFSWQLETWTPNAKIVAGTNMSNFARSIVERLRQGV